MIWEFKNVLIRLCLVAVYGCRDAKPAIKWEFIPGTYIRFYQPCIWKYERIAEKPECQLLTTAGFNDAEAEMMEGIDTGNLLSFEMKQNCLFIRTLRYQKI